MARGRMIDRYVLRYAQCFLCTLYGCMKHSPCAFTTYNCNGWMKARCFARYSARFCNASVSCHGALLPWLFFDSKNACRSARPLPAAASLLGNWLTLGTPARCMCRREGNTRPFGRRGPEGGGEVGGKDWEHGSFPERGRVATEEREKVARSWHSAAQKRS